MKLKVYLSGEIHTDWREQIIQGCKDNDLAVEFYSAVTDHEASDAAGDMLGAEDNSFWRDHKSAKVNAVRTKTLIEKSDIAIIRFGENSNSGTQLLMPVTAQRLVNPILPCMKKT